MSFFKNLFIERCPKCNKVLETKQSNIFKSVIVKSCPEGHFQKEFHPALETYIESNKVS